MAVLTVTGPEWSESFLQPLAEQLRGLQHDVLVHLGPPAELAGSDRWGRTDVLLSMPVPVTRSDMEAASSLRGIVAPGIGVDNFEREAADDLAIAVVSGRVPEHAESLAEATIMLMLGASYDLVTSQELLRRGQVRLPSAITARMIKGRTIGIIGYGSIAQAVIERLTGWDVSILVHTRSPRSDSRVSFVPLDALLSQSDIVIVLASLNPSSFRLLNADRLSLMKRGALLVNTARGGIVDEDALVERCRSGAIGNVALDVFETEPLPPGDPLRTLSGALLTPHSAGITLDSSQAMPKQAIRNIQDLLAGTLPQHTVNTNEIHGAWRRRWTN